MRKFIKRSLIVLSGLLVIVAIVLTAVFFQLNSLAKMAIEKYGSEISGVKVTVGIVSISPRSGDGSVSSFAMGNPHGFKAKKSLKAEQISLKIDEASLRTNTIIVQEVSINSPDIYYEAVRGTNNFVQIRDTINEKLKTGAGEESSDLLEDKVIIIQDLYIKHGSVLVSAPQLGSQTYRVALHDIHMHNLGKGDKPGNMSKIMARVMATITNDVINTVGMITVENFTKQLMQGAINNPVNDVQKTVEGILPGVQNIIPH